MRRINGVRPLTPHEATAFRAAAAHLTDFNRSRELFPLVQLNARSVIKGAIRILELPREKLRDTPRRQHLRREFNRLIINYLSSFRLYLDQMPKRLTDLYTEQSPQFS